MFTDIREKMVLICTFVLSLFLNDFIVFLDIIEEKLPKSSCWLAQEKFEKSKVAL